ncbi:acetyl-coenzyme A synthetase 2-like, mitochondrial [Anolis carolinensis]|uniref:Acetyl-coenzyme A synthetase n=1 Tax=Anolis carolinensis TaxID=28377 RepID=G1KSJ6_ANOCA|nr:PREDICTED: acetyl-coenzyme A synthetase 2-like, mitochondrial [Anolis carolinensis]XP_008123285.1 PREDICTED: acetyl-coenzyme A synthetase 2-like, mitochondrial [Anolis carolinensis]XP_008123337.1 PREDICTED: acetyl-coenzyme A synthetase 2-like, mitochondrial [Anolis carolinensis]XP_008123380.1 PREDICTED: acetyl-coenzyme A synthetase 2-like, mitochondrial [Anolis carolinensis]|eukprot:XP_003214500.2 PREDICTED: acetyl-coenzyme A synthetase 2-like, mitochondrial [Anolis carolinensis]
MAWLLLRTCFQKVVPGGRFSYKTRAWSNGPLTAYMPEVTSFPGPVDHQGLYQVSVEQTEAFWGALARSRLSWISPFHSVSNCNLQQGHVSWFLGGQLNVAVNCLDRHVHQAPNKVALIWEKDEPGQEERITYRELLEKTCRLANTLKRQGVKKGDRVVIYMPPCPMAVMSMLACARIGAIHTVVFAGFSSVALADRIQDAKSETVITVNQSIRGGKVVELKQTVDQAIKMCPMVKRVFVSKRTDAKVSMSAVDIPLEQEMAKEDANCAPVALESEDFLFLLYTSGSTGKPKGLVHSQGGYLLYVALTHKYVFDYHDGDVFCCVADIGWITGHSYVVYGPLCNGATTVLFESTPLYPNPGRYWETVERLKINQFYGAPTAIRLLLSHGDNWVKKYDRSSLKILGSVGEPINTEAWEWFFNVVGNGQCPVVDTWWQTETGGICIAPRPSNPGDEILPAMAMRPFFGIRPSILDDKGNVLTQNDISGALCISQAWPGMARTIYNDHQRFLETYLKPYPGYFFTGDGAYRTSKGYYQLTGRLDDVINVSGHRLGTAEIEDVLNKHEAVAESAVIGYPHKVKGEGVYAFVMLKEDCSLSQESLVSELRGLVSKEIAKYAAPEYIQISQHLPKTRSGKIMRRVLKKIIENKADELGDLTTLDDHETVKEIIEGHGQLLQKEQGR